jgi:hypothetical protein
MGTQGYRVVGQHYGNTNPGIQSGWPALWGHRDTEWLASIMGTQTQGYRVVGQPLTMMFMTSMAIITHTSKMLNENTLKGVAVQENV